MNYRHDIFLSYKWGEDRKVWVDEIFLPILREALENVKGKLTPQDIFHDVSIIKSGADLPRVLQEGVIYSRSMISIISLPYFQDSVWCPTEFFAMFHRQQNAIANNVGHQGVIFPVVFVRKDEITKKNVSPVYNHSGIGPFILNLSPLNIDQKHNKVNRAFRESDGYNDLKDQIEIWVEEHIFPRIIAAPTWDRQWLSDYYFKPQKNVHPWDRDWLPDSFFNSSIMSSSVVMSNPTL